MASDHFRLAECDNGLALPSLALHFLDEGFELAGHAARDLGLNLIDRAKLLRIAQPCFKVFGFHPGIAGERIDLAAIIDGHKAAPVALGEPKAALLERPLKRRLVVG